MSALDAVHCCDAGGAEGVGARRGGERGGAPGAQAHYCTEELRGAAGARLTSFGLQRLLQSKHWRRMLALQKQMDRIPRMPQLQMCECWNGIFACACLPALCLHERQSRSAKVWPF